jgi:hypothetical protein
VVDTTRHISSRLDAVTCSTAETQLDPDPKAKGKSLFMFTFQPLNTPTWTPILLASLHDNPAIMSSALRHSGDTCAGRSTYTYKCELGGSNRILYYHHISPGPVLYLNLLAHGFLHREIVNYNVNITLDHVFASVGDGCKQQSE